MGKDVIDFNADHLTVTNTGQSILVIDLAAFGDPTVFKQAVDQLSQDIKQSQRLPGVERIWLPGEQSHHKRVKAQKLGIQVSSFLVNELNALADKLGIKPVVTMA